MKPTRVLIVSLVIIAMLFMTVPISTAQGEANPAVLPPTARVQGMTLGEWSAKLGQALLEIPASVNPGLGYPWTNCYLERIGNVGLGVSYFYSGSSECEMPAGMILYLNIVAAEWDTSVPPPSGVWTEETLRAFVLQFVPENLEASVDGIPVRNLEAYTTLTPLFQLVVPEDNVIGGVPAGTYDAIIYCTGFMLAPLSPGEHTVHVHGEVPSFPFIYDWVYHITVTN